MIGMRPPNNFHPPPMMMTRPQPQPGGMPPGIGIARPQVNIFSFFVKLKLFKY